MQKLDVMKIKPIHETKIDEYEYTFRNHELLEYQDLDNWTLLKFGQVGTIMGLIRIVFHKESGTLMFSGDYGCATFCFSGGTTLFTIANISSISYFLEKCYASEEGRNFKVWDSDACKKAFIDYINDEFENRELDEKVSSWIEKFEMIQMDQQNAIPEEYHENDFDNIFVSEYDFKSWIDSYWINFDETAYEMIDMGFIPVGRSYLMLYGLKYALLRFEEGDYKERVEKKQNELQKEYDAIKLLKDTGKEERKEALANLTIFQQTNSSLRRKACQFRFYRRGAWLILELDDKEKHLKIMDEIAGFLNKNGWKFYIDQYYKRNYKCLIENRRWGVKNDLHVSFESHPKSLKIEFHQELRNTHKCGGKYEHDRFDMMPYFHKELFEKTSIQIVQFCKKNYKIDCYDQSEIEYRRYPSSIVKKNIILINDLIHMNYNHICIHSLGENLELTAICSNINGRNHAIYCIIPNTFQLEEGTKIYKDENFEYYLHPDEISVTQQKPVDECSEMVIQWSKREIIEDKIINYSEIELEWGLKGIKNGDILKEGFDETDFYYTYFYSILKLFSQKFPLYFGHCKDELYRFHQKQDDREIFAFVVSN